MSHLRFFLSLMSVAVVAAGQWASGAGVYLTPKLYPSGDSPVDVAVRDFNNDGFADIVSANVNDKTVSVFLNDGTGGFGLANTFAVGAGANEVASADLDGDGNADLVVTDSNASVYIALGHGDGTFGAFTAINVPNHPRGIAIADLNGDGIPDLALALFGPTQSFAGQVAVLIGHGDGSFAAPVVYDLGEVSAVRLVAVDLNNDGKLDLAVALQHGSRGTEGLGVLLGNGDGTFQPVVTSVAKVNTSDVAAADFNGDGNMDLALATEDGAVEVVLGNGDGTFQPAIAYDAGGPALGNGAMGDTVSIADMDGDGVLDLVYGASYTAILLGDGSGGFSPPSFYGIGQGFARVGYLNHDKIPDIIGNGGPPGVGVPAIAVAFGRGHGSITSDTLFPFGSFIDEVNSFDSADFDGDGHPDIVVGGDSELFFLHGNGDGTFGEAVSFQDLQAVGLLAADFNGDGKQDLLAVEFFGVGGFYIILGNGDGTFQDPVLIRVGTFTAEFEPIVGDFNHDGKTDVALADTVSTNLYILLGNGDGTFQPALKYKTPDFPQKLVVADFNLDGNPDLAVSEVSSDLVSIYLGRGDGTFNAPLSLTSSGAVYLAAGDLNLDGKPDLVVGGGSDGLKLYLGNGDGTFGAGATVYPDYGPVQIADIDLDGRPDIVLSTSGSQTIYTSSLVGLRGLGDGTFRSPLVFPTGSYPGNFVLRDLNGDGSPEAIVGSLFHWLAVLRNISHPR